MHGNPIGRTKLRREYRENLQLGGQPIAGYLEVIKAADHKVGYK